MQKELYDIEITFEGKAPVIVAGLTHEQMAQLQGVFKSASGGREWRLAHVHWPQPLTGWIDGAWRKLNAWMMPLLLIAVLGGMVMAQDAHKVKAVEPIKIEVAASDDDEHGKELRRLIHRKLKENRGLAFPARGDLDFSVTVTGDKLIADTGCVGFLGGMVLVGRDGMPRISVFTGADMPALAEVMARAITARSSQLRRK